MRSAVSCFDFDVDDGALDDVAVVVVDDGGGVGDAFDCSKKLAADESEFDEAPPTLDH